MLLWLLVIALIIFAVAGGVALSHFLWLVLIVALVVADHRVALGTTRGLNAEPRDTGDRAVRPSPVSRVD